MDQYEIARMVMSTLNGTWYWVRFDEATRLSIVDGATLKAAIDAYNKKEQTDAC